MEARISLKKYFYGHDKFQSLKYHKGCRMYFISFTIVERALEGQ
jgi:hypothetical protein